MSALRVCVPGPQYSFWRSSKFRFLVLWPRGSPFWREPKIDSGCFWRCVLSRHVLFQQREIRVSWRLCNNYEIYLWLWKVWRWLFVHKVSFMLQEHVKTTKTDKHAFSLLKKDELGTQKAIIFYCPISINQIEKERNVCGQKNTGDYWRCVLSSMWKWKVCLHFNQ